MISLNAPQRRTGARFFRVSVLFSGLTLLSAVDVSGQTVTRRPYLQSGTATSVVVRWRTDTSFTGRVRYGTNLVSLSSQANEAASAADHEIKLTGLLPDTKYFYSVGTATTTLMGGDTNHFFVTSPPSGTPKPTRIWVIGDSGTASANQVNVRNAYEMFAGVRRTDLWLMLGDNAYENGFDSEYQTAVFNVYTNQLRQSVLWPALGNHDTAHSDVLSDGYPYFNMFTLPKNGEAGGIASGSEHYYSFDYGNLHFICLDSMTATLRTPQSAMLVWLTNDLANVVADWTIAFWHHPPYTKGSHDSDLESELVELRENFLPLLEQAGVDLVLSGHSHSYERSFLLDQHYGLSGSFASSNLLHAGSGRETDGGAYLKPSGGLVPHQGAVYAVVGCSGRTNGGSLNHPAMYISLNNLGSLVLDINSNRLDAIFLGDGGTTNDFFSIVKINHAPVASNLFASVNGDFPATLTLTGSDINRDEVFFVPNTLPAHGLLSSFNPVTGAVGYTPAHGFRGTDIFKFYTHDGQTNGFTATVTLNVIVPNDVNANGLPDYWETNFDLTDPQADADTDGLSNAQEYWANTNPTDATSRLRITSVIRASNGTCTLQWPSIGGTRYRVSYRDGNVSGDFIPLVRPPYEEIDAASVGAASTQYFTDDFALTGSPPANGARFFRIQVIK